MNRLSCLGAAAGLLSLVALTPDARADRLAAARVCTVETHQRVMVSRAGDPASDRVLALIEGNLPLYAVDITLDAALKGEVTAQQMEIMRAVAGELGMVSEDSAPTSGE